MDRKGNAPEHLYLLYKLGFTGKGIGRGGTGRGGGGWGRIKTGGGG